jgi:hypothetical protein
MSCPNKCRRNIHLHLAAVCQGKRDVAPAQEVVESSIIYLNWEVRDERRDER